MEILGVRIDEVTMDEAVNRAATFLEEEKFHMIFTPNPEMLMVAKDDDEFRKILNSSAMNIPVVFASGPVVDFQHTRQERVLKASMAQRAMIHAVLISEMKEGI